MCHICEKKNTKNAFLSKQNSLPQQLNFKKYFFPIPKNAGQHNKLISNIKKKDMRKTVLSVK